MSKAYLVLENGSTFTGQAFGLAGEVTAEVVFSTGMIGYLETLTDKSYFGQIVVQTFPSIGNYGVIPADFDSDVIGPKGYIIKEWCQVPSNFRSEGDLDTFFKEKGIVGLCGIDTRALTKIIREEGVMNGAIVTDLSHADPAKIKAYRVQNAVETLSAKSALQVGEGSHKIALLDLGLNNSLLHELCKRDVAVTVCPHTTTVAALKEMGAEGIVLSGGPGAPDENEVVITNLKGIMELGLPILGIGLGHQLLALANGIQVEKLKFGHRGANQPVKNLETGRVYITSQNHGYAVVTSSIDETKATEMFRNVNDKTCEGIHYKNIPAFSVQFLPEVSGSTMDTSWIYDKFVEMMKEGN